MNHGLTVHWKAPGAMPSMPNTSSTAVPMPTWRGPVARISLLGQRVASETASRCPLQRPQAWHCEALVMWRTSTSGAQSMRVGRPG